MDDLERARRSLESIARDEIRDLVARYNANGDSGRFDSLLELFARDAVMETTEFSGEHLRYDGIEEIRKIFTGAKSRIDGRPDRSVPPYLRHFTSTHQIDLIDADHASGRLYFAVLMAHGLDHWGRYVDDYVRDVSGDGRWKFTHRRVRVDGMSPGSWFAGGQGGMGRGASRQAGQ